MHVYSNCVCMYAYIGMYEVYVECMYVYFNEWRSDRVLVRLGHVCMYVCMYVCADPS